MQARALPTLLAVIVMAGSAQAQCPTNAAGGPTLVTLTTSNTGVGTDFDVGTTALVHGVPLPALTMSFCLEGCDASTDPDCAVTNVRPDPSSPGIAPPLPIDTAGVDACVALRFPTTPSATGLANVQTGALGVSTSIEMRIFQAAGANAICPSCVAGTCSGGANAGSPCTIQRTAVLGPITYNLSTACQPSPGLLVDAVSVPLGLVTGVAAQGTCPNQPAGDRCSSAGAGTCNEMSCFQGIDGIVQNCCSDDEALSCFPAAGVGRQGQANVPAPAWPSTAYPKQATEIVVSAACASAGGSAGTNILLGLPAPAAVQMGVTSTWAAMDTPVTTTTLGGGTTTTTLAPACTPPCDDDDVCTTDTCAGTACTFALASPGIAGARCLIQRMRDRPLCGTATVDAKLDRTIDTALRKADGFLGKADTATGRKRTRMLKKARAQLALVDRKTNKAATKSKIEASCGTTIVGEVGRIRSAFAEES